MFGYVRTHTPEMKVSEYEYYRAAYCGLCRSMGKCTGQCSRMTLSYDFAFLALVRLALSGEGVEIKRRRCIAHPLRKRAMMEKNSELEFCAYAAALLTYHKLADDITDERGAKRAVARMTRPMAKSMRKKSLRKGGLGALDEHISACLSRLSEFERSKKPSVDDPAEIFGELLSEIVAEGFEGPGAKIAKSIGYHVGKWIYITDALDDLPEDIKKGRYNPFILLYGGELDEERKSLVRAALKAELCDAEGAFDLIDFGDNRMIENIIYNIIYLGMPNTVDRVMKRDGCADENKSVGRRKGQFEEI